MEPQMCQGCAKRVACDLRALITNCFREPRIQLSKCDQFVSLDSLEKEEQRKVVKETLEKLYP